MVFLFIAFLVTIFLFTFPFKVEFTLFSNSNKDFPTLSLTILGMHIKNPKRENIFIKHLKKYISISEKGVFQNITHIPLKICKVDMVLPKSINPTILYPLSIVIMGEQYNNSSTIVQNRIAIGNDFYLQIRLVWSINLHLIFSILLQILKKRRS